MPPAVDTRRDDPHYIREQVKDNLRTMYGDAEIRITTAQHGKPDVTLSELNAIAVYYGDNLIYYERDHAGTLSLLKRLLEVSEQRLGKWETNKGLEQQVRKWEGSLRPLEKEPKKNQTSLLDRQPVDLELLETDDATLCGQE